MDKETRNRIQRATQAARALLEREYGEQLAGVFDIRADGTIAAEPGNHLDAEQRVLRTKLIAAVDHLRAAGKTSAEAVASHLRETSFTMLNRFVALKMLEARGLVQECVSRGDQSAGFKEFSGLAPGLVQISDRGYRLYIESIFDEVGCEVRVLFDRRDPAGLLWPRRQALSDLLTVLNAVELATVWREDETIGWFYQYFNADEERRQMRAESQTPRSSRELAVRNQFFTPRYVVEFLADNTLGRIWYEMRQGRTALAHECRYLVCTPGERFLGQGTNSSPTPAASAMCTPDGTPNPRTTWVPFRSSKDPRDLKIIDPACGSGHFLLYAFDLLLRVYDEAWEDPAAPCSEQTARTLRADYPTRSDLQRAMPGLILRHNIHGIDIDPRAAQIAALALWMRAQRAYHEANIARGERPSIKQTQIAVAEPMPGEPELRTEFIASLSKQLGQVVAKVFDAMVLAAEVGSLLQVEATIRSAIRDVYGDTGSLFRKSDELKWREVEAELMAALHEYAARTERGGGYRRRLFADDAAQGFAFLDLCRGQYDVVLMNPPFGDCTERAKPVVFESFGRERIELGGCFITRYMARLTAGGLLGVIANRTLLFAATLEEWRNERLSCSTTVVDLGHGVLDALVETAALTVSAQPTEEALFVGAIDEQDKQTRLARAVQDVKEGVCDGFRRTSDFRALFGAPFAYWAPSSLIARTARLRSAESVGAIARQGLATCDNFRFLRLADEISAQDSDWVPLTKGGEYQPFWAEVPLRVRWADDGREVKAHIDALHGQWSRVVQSTNLYLCPGATYSERTASSLSLRVLPRGSIFDKVGPFVGAEEEARSCEVALGLIGLSYTLPYRFLIETAVGLRDATTSGSAARHYLPSMVQRLPWPDLDEGGRLRLNNATEDAIRAARELASTKERSEFWHEPQAWGGFASLAEYSTARMHRWCDLLSRVYRSAEVLERESRTVFGVGPERQEEWRALEAVAGKSALEYREADDVQCDALVDLMDMPSERLIADLAAAGKAHATTYKKGYWGDRNVELVAHLLEVHPVSLLRALKRRPASSAWRRKSAWRVLSSAMAFAIGRMTPSKFFVASECRVSADMFSRPGHGKEEEGVPRGGPRMLVDDPGHPDDVIAHLEETLTNHAPAAASDDICDALGVGRGELRRLVATSFFSRHLAEYSDYRRQAPVYWQMGTSSARYSVWLFYRHLSRDSFFTLLNDCVSPRLSQEERAVSALASRSDSNPSASQRKELADAESFVEELRNFRDDLARVAPLWRFDPNDGVLVNFAPLWRLVPHHKPWQKELKATWDALCDGQYTWAHLAMHLWPERVVPKCVDDRSLAIAHGLEEVFWVEGRDGKWQKRKIDDGTVERLIAERTSPAVKAALKSLIEAPAPSTGRGGGRRAATPRRTSPPRRTPRESVAPDAAVATGGDTVDRVREAIAGTADGVSKADVMAATGITDGQWIAAISALLAQGLVTKTGERRGARYHIVETGGRP